MLDHSLLLKGKRGFHYSEGNRPKFHIGYGVDDNYSRCMAASLASVCAHNRDLSLTFHVFTDGFCAETLSRLEQMARQFSVDIDVYTINAQYFKQFPTQSHLPMATYYRYALPEIVREERVLHLDADVVNLRSLRKLLSLDIRRYIAAVVPDVEWMNRKRNKALGLKNHTYFNSGVLLINTQKWNALDVYGQSFALLKENFHKFRYVDQDILNVVLHGQVLYLERYYDAIDLKELDEQKIVLLHFAAQPKPWNVAWPLSRICNAFNRDLYSKYEAMTPWRGEAPWLPKNSKEEKIYAKCLFQRGDYARALKWYEKYLFSKIRGFMKRA